MDWLEKRRLILAELMERSAAENLGWEEDDLYDQMSQHPIIVDRQPNYSIGIFRGDHSATIQAINERREQMVGDYLADHLDTLAYLHADLLTEYKLAEHDAKTKGQLVSAILSVLEREGKLIPMEVPKTKVVDKRSVSLTADDILKARRELSREQQSS